MVLFVSWLVALSGPEKRINLNSLNWCVTESDFPYIIVADLPLGPITLFARSKITVKNAHIKFDTQEGYKIN